MSIRPIRLTLSIIALTFSSLYAQLLPEDFFPELKDIAHNLNHAAPQALIQAERIAEAQGNETSSLSAYLPLLRSEFNYNHNIEKRPDIKDTKTQKGIDGRIFLSQPLYHWGSRKAERTIAKIRTDSSKIHYKNALRNVLNEVRRVYLHLYLQKTTYHIAQDNLTLAKNNLTEIQHKKQLGTATLIDLQEAELALKETSHWIKSLECDITHHLNYLNDISGAKVELQHLPQPETLSTHFSNNLQQTICPSSETNSDHYRSLSNELAIEKANYIKLRAQQLPSFDLTTGYFRDRVDGPDNTGSIFRDNFYGGIRGTWNIFDGRLTEGQKKSSRARQRRLEREMKEEALRQKTLQTQLLNSLEFAQEEIALKKARLNIATSKLETQKALLKQKAITAQAFLNEKRQHDESIINLTRSITHFLNQFSQLTSHSQQDSTLNQLTQ